MSLLVPVPGLVLQVQSQVTPALFTSESRWRIPRSWCLPGSGSRCRGAQHDASADADAAGDIVAVHAASARTRLSGHKRPQATRPRTMAIHDESRSTTSPLIPGNPVGRGATGRYAPRPAGYPGLEEKSLSVIRRGSPWCAGAVASSPLAAKLPGTRRLQQRH